ncbi:MAG TPA: hypothetical protein PLN52_14340 [Opitutaceae bacterium]|nr:hypothetical protein [Opitutaceae bacterium]
MTLSCHTVCLLVVASLAPWELHGADTPVIRAERVMDRPLITPSMLPGEEGESINGPSLIRVPDWVANPLGRYYLYFAHHDGKYIRFAYADEIAGPWTLVPGGLLPVGEQKAVRGHIASPEAVIDETTKQIFLFTHGPNRQGAGPQISTVAVSTDGRTFRDLGNVVGPAYLRVFNFQGTWYALNGSGVLHRTQELGKPFTPVGQIIGQDILDALDPWLRGEPGAEPAERRPKNGDGRYGIRHVGTDVKGDRLYVYFSCLQHRPERIIATTIELRGPPETWRARGAIEVLQPERPWEGSDLPLAYSRGGSTIKYGYNRVRELRDPGVYREGEEAWLLYSTAGEYGLGLAKLHYSATAP